MQILLFILIAMIAAELFDLFYGRFGHDTAPDVYVKILLIIGAHKPASLG